MSKKILVTGANGQLGKTIEELYAKNKEGLSFTFVSKQELDITKKIELEAYFKNNSFDFCINCAAYTNVEQAEKTPKPAFLVNAEGVKNLAVQCKAHNVVLIHISTDYVFDGTKTTPYKVDDETNPINEYGKSKLKGELYVKEILEHFYIVRTSWLYSEYNHNFFTTILKLAKVKKEISVVIDQISTPTYTKDLAKAIVKIIFSNSQRFGIYHFSNKGRCSWFVFATQILKKTNIVVNLIPVTTADYFSIAKRPLFSLLDTKKTISEFNIEIVEWNKALEEIKIPSDI